MADTRSMTYAEAVNSALSRILETDDKALVFGEDVGAPGGVFGVTKGLQKRFGDRVFDTPISESAILGSSVGSAMMGMRPIPEIMWADFTLVALDQIVNQAANVRYVTRGELSAPITIRMQQGSAPGACAQHSQSLEALFTHVPGLRVVMPATAQDAYDCLISAHHCPDPTIVIENRTLYHAGKTEVTLGEDIEAIGAARLRRSGSDLTIVTWGAMQFAVEKAARTVAEEDGIECEVIDLRWLRPYDAATVRESAQRTSRLLVVHEAHTVGGFGAEVIADVLEHSPTGAVTPMRVGTPPVRIPAAPSLAQAVIPNEAAIVAAIRRLVDGGV